MEEIEPSLLAVVHCVHAPFRCTVNTEQISLRPGEYCRMIQGIVIWVEDVIQHQERASCRHFVECSQQVVRKPETQEHLDFESQASFHILGNPRGARRMSPYENVRVSPQVDPRLRERKRDRAGET